MHTTVGNDNLAKQKKLISIGIHSLALFTILNTAIRPDGLTLTKTVIYLPLIISLICLSLSLLRTNTALFNPITKLIAYSLILWGFIQCLISLQFNFDKILTLFFNPWIGGMIWLMPLVLFFGADNRLFDHLNDIFKKHLKIGILLSAPFLALFYYQPSDKNLDFLLGFNTLFYAAPFLLICGGKAEKFKKVSYLALLISTIIYYADGNRFFIIFNICFSLIALISGKSENKSQLVSKFLVFLIAFFILTTILLSFDFQYTLSKDWTTDTRSFIVTEMQADFDLSDWIFGKGALGTYYSPYFNTIRNAYNYGDSPIRQVVEVGYLFYILKTGLIGLFLYFMLSTKAAKQSLFSISGRQGFANFTYILSYQVIMLIKKTEVLSFTPSLLLYWVVIGSSLSNNMNNGNIGSHEKNFNCNSGIQQR